VKKLIRGIVDFHARVLPEYKERFAELAAAGQKPGELFVACSDSRVVVDLFSETEPGDMFELRNVGNMIPRESEDAVRAAGSAGAVVEYAIEVLGVRDVVVCGHSECGAMKAILGLAAEPEEAPSLRGWLQHGEVALERYRAGEVPDDSLAPHNQLSQVNVLVQLENVRTYPGVVRAIDEGKLRLHGWWFDVSTAHVLAYDPGQEKFRRIEAGFADELLEMWD
jgi:carbonic anhydrase